MIFRKNSPMPDLSVMSLRRRTFDIIQIGTIYDLPSQAFDIASICMILINLFIAVFETFDESLPYLPILSIIETITVVFFTIEYVLRLWTADYLYPSVKYPDISRSGAVIKYAFSPSGIVDILSFLPFYLPVFFPAGMMAFRMFRIVRILRLFRVNAYSDALTVVGNVIKSKKDQLLSSVFIILILMLASSLCMYSLEHDAQPEAFKNAFSGLWWSVATLMTVGYGDIYPITVVGRLFGIAITFLGVGLVAIPTGIISAGFVEQYTEMKSIDEHSKEENIRFVRISISESHPWKGQKLKELPLPPELLAALIVRNGRVLSPEPDQILAEGDQILLGAEGCSDDIGITLKQISLSKKHPWTGLCIKDLDISRQTLILLIRRDEKLIIPDEDTVLSAADHVLVYNKKKLIAGESIRV